MCYYQGRTRQACEARERALADLATRKEQVEEKEQKEREQDELETAVPDLRRSAA